MNQNHTYHKTLLKVILNPILTKFGWILVSSFKGDCFLGYKLRTYPEHCKGPFKVWISLFRKEKLK